MEIGLLLINPPKREIFESEHRWRPAKQLSDLQHTLILDGEQQTHFPDSLLDYFSDTQH